jgi:hypothetical protein
MHIAVDELKCGAVANALRQVNLPPAIEPWAVKAEGVTFDLATLNLVLVAVCHQTQNLTGKINGIEKRGWDFLQIKFQTWAEREKSATSVDRLRLFTANELRDLLNCGEQLSNNDLEVRAAYIRNCGEKLKANGANSFTDLYTHCERRIATGPINLLASLSEFEAFDDPLKKKSLFLLGLNAATCSWDYPDPDCLESPVDYHEVRGHLRIGTIDLDRVLRERVATKQLIDNSTDVAIREAVTQAMRTISELSGYSQMQLHYALWNLFRTRCVRTQPNCYGENALQLPEAYVGMAPNGVCCLVEYCNSAGAAIAIDEPKVDTTWY